MRRGTTLFATHGWDELPEVRGLSTRSASELVILAQEPASQLLQAAKGRAPDIDGEWLFVTCPDVETAQRLAFQGSVGAGRWLVWKGRAVQPRDGFRLQRAGGLAVTIPGPMMELHVVLWTPDDERELSPEALAGDLRVELGPEVCRAVELRAVYRSVSGWLLTSEPGRALQTLVPFAAGRQLQLWLTARSSAHFARAMERLERDVAGLAGEGVLALR